jgi:hypothetical protein
MVQARGVKMSQPTVGNHFTRWSRDGVCESQPGVNGRPGAAWLFNWTGRPASEFTLRDLVEPALTEIIHQGGRTTARPDQDRDAMKLRSGLRLFLGVDERGTDRALLKACEAVGVEELYDLPDLLYARALESVKKGTAANYRSRLRAVMRDAAAVNRIPVAFPRVWDDDVWAETRDRLIGAATGNLTDQQRAARCHWNALAEAAKGIDSSLIPEQLTRAICERIYNGWRRNAKAYRVAQTKTLLRNLAREQGWGPYVEEVQDGAQRTRNGWPTAGRLMSADGSAHTGSWPGLLKMVSEAGYGEEWIDFLTWYGEFLTLDDAELARRRADFPERGVQLRLRDTSLVKRIINVRTILGRAPQFLQKAPPELTPYDVFGRHAQVMLAEMERWWQQRAADPYDVVSSEHSDGYQKLVIAYGLIARALGERIEHRRLVAAEEASRDHHAEDAIQIARTVAERILHKTYADTRKRSDAIEERRRAEDTGSGENSVKSIERIVRLTPASYWIAILDEMHRELRSLIRWDAEVAIGPKSIVNERDFHCLVADTYYHGILISTAGRISETAHIRLDTQYTEEMRALGQDREQRWRVVDRKTTRNTIAIRPTIWGRYVPLWLEALYLNQTRPFFMRDWPQREGPRKKKRPVQEHAHLFVDRHGRAFGCVEEAADGSGRDGLAMQRRLATLRTTWQTAMARVAARLGLPISTYPREYANHAVRAALGFEIFRVHGIEAASHLLGDRVDSLWNVYVTVQTNLSKADSLAPPPADLPKPVSTTEASLPAKQPRHGNAAKAAATPAAGTTASLGDTLLRGRIERLLDQLLAGEISEERYVEAVARLERVVKVAA